MLGLMTKDTNTPDERIDRRDRIRLIVDTEEIIRLAVRLRGLRTGQDNSQVVTEILRKALAEEIAEASKFPQISGKKPRPKKGGAE